MWRHFPSFPCVSFLQSHNLHHQGRKSSLGRAIAQAVQVRGFVADTLGLGSFSDPSAHKIFRAGCNGGRVPKASFAFSQGKLRNLLL